MKTSPIATERLRASILRDAVDDNVDAIHDRLPKPHRPVQRDVRVGSGWSWRTGIPLAVVIGLAGVARWPAANGSGGTPTSTTAAELRVTAQPVAPEAAAPRVRPAATPDPAVLGHAIDPEVLALGVRRIVLDAGHGGDNLGTASASGLREKDLTLDIAERVRQIVAARGFEAVMTRTSDAAISLQERATAANGRRGDIFVSIHLNALKPASAQGIETYYLGPSEGPEPEAIAAAENQHSGYSLSDMRSLLERIYTDARRGESKRLAEHVQQALVRSLRTVEPAITNRGVKTAPFVVLVATEMPAILAEVSCLSNRAEAERLGTADYRQTVAEALASGIQAFAAESRTSGAERTGTSGS